MDKMYVAGPMWRPVGDDKRREGDVIEEANTWPTVRALVGRRMLVEKPRGEWVYYATRKWRCAEGLKTGDVVTSVTDLRTINRLLDTGHLTRKDSADLEPAPVAPKRRKKKGSIL